MLIENFCDSAPLTILSGINGNSTAGSNTFGETARTGVEHGAAAREHITRFCGWERSALLQHGHDAEPFAREQQHRGIVFVSLACNDRSVRKGEIKTPFVERRANTNIAPIYVRKAIMVYGNGNGFGKGWLS